MGQVVTQGFLWNELLWRKKSQAGEGGGLSLYPLWTASDHGKRRLEAGLSTGSSLFWEGVGVLQ